MSSNTGAFIHPGVELGTNVEVQHFALLGVPPQGAKPGQFVLKIGKDTVLRSHCVLYAGSIIGNNFSAGHGTLIREHCIIGSQCSVGSSTVLEHHVVLGNNVRIHSKAFIPEFSILEDSCWIGPCAVFTNVKYPAAAESKSRLKGITVRRMARVGAGAMLLPGVTIGEGALVGAGSVVTKDVAPGMVVAGNPARAIGKVSDLHYSDSGILVYGEPQ